MAFGKLGAYFIGGILHAWPMAYLTVGTLDDIDAFVSRWHATKVVRDEDIGEFFLPLGPIVGGDWRAILKGEEIGCDMHCEPLLKVLGLLSWVVADWADNYLCV